MCVCVCVCVSEFVRWEGPRGYMKTPVDTQGVPVEGDFPADHDPIKYLQRNPKNGKFGVKFYCCGNDIGSVCGGG